MELGGNAPFLVLDDADLDVAVAAATVAKLRNVGASCVAANRFYVHASLAGRFAKEFGNALGEQRVGDGLSPGAQVGALVSDDERDKVASIVESAESAGATINVGGHLLDRRGAFYPPTLLTNVDVAADIVRTEIFGPVAPVVEFEPWRITQPRRRRSKRVSTC